MCSPRLRIMAVAMMLLAPSALVAAQDNEVNAQASFVRKISGKDVFLYVVKTYLQGLCFVPGCRCEDSPETGLTTVRCECQPKTVRERVISKLFCFSRNYGAD